MTLSQSIARSRRDMVEHQVQARRSIAKTIKRTTRAAGAPGPPVATGNLRRKLRLNMDPRAWKLGDTLKLTGSAFYSLFHAIRTTRTSRQNRKGYHATIDAEVRKGFRKFAWRPR